MMPVLFRIADGDVRQKYQIATLKYININNPILDEIASF